MTDVIFGLYFGFPITFNIIELNYLVIQQYDSDFKFYFHFIP